MKNNTTKWLAWAVTLASMSALSCGRGEQGLDDLRDPCTFRFEVDLNPRDAHGGKPGCLGGHSRLANLFDARTGKRLPSEIAVKAEECRKRGIQFIVENRGPVRMFPPTVHPDQCGCVSEATREPSRAVSFRYRVGAGAACDVCWVIGSPEQGPWTLPIKVRP